MLQVYGVICLFFMKQSILFENINCSYCFAQAMETEIDANLINSVASVFDQLGNSRLLLVLLFVRLLDVT